MGVKERKARAKAALRAKIIEAANALFLERGYERTNIRLIAQAVEYSPATIYLYFKNKEALFQEIQEEAFAAFMQALEAASIITDPLSRLQELCRRYLDFSHQRPNYYQLLFSNRVHTALPEGSTYAGQVHQFLVATIQVCKREGYFLRKSAPVLATVIGSFLHGQAILPLNLYAKADREQLAEESVQAFLDMLSRW